MNRICIYLTYDKQKIIDKYIGYMLRELKSCASYLVVVCNETEVVKGQDILEEYADEIFLRENIGFDAGGFKDALCKFIGWNKILEYDELILVNDSMFGPFRPMKAIFSEMQTIQLDFWGLAKHGECINKIYGYFPEHIQTYFMVIGFEMLHCLQFQEYWEKLPYFHTFLDTVLKHEVKFTSYFAELGYSYGALANTEINDSKNIRNNYLQYATISYELIKKRNYPFLKKQQIAYNTLDQQTQENLRQAINYIDKYTEYDVELIWDNIIRTLNIADLQRSLHLQYIIPSRNEIVFYEKLVFLVFITFNESEEYVIEYLDKVNLDYIVIILAEEKEYLETYKKKGFYCKRYQANKVNELLAEYSEYDLVCVLHDTDITSNRKPSCVGKSYFYNIWENLFKDNNHIYGILGCFEKEPRLGFLSYPQPNFEEYFGEYGKGWNGRYSEVLKVTESLNINCQLSEFQEPISITNDFWIRGCILKKISHMELQDCKLLPYIWTYLAQDHGYYSGIVESMEYAAMNEVNLQYYLQQITFKIREQYGNFINFNELKEKFIIASNESQLVQFNLSKLLDYCNKYSSILVYGAGWVAQLYRRYLPCIESYVVSDGKEKPKEIEGVPVKYLSEIKNPEKYGILLCINQKNQKEIILTLKERGINHYFCI